MYHTYNHKHKQFFTLLKCKGTGPFGMMVSVRINVKGTYSEKVRSEENTILKIRDLKSHEGRESSEACGRGSEDQESRG